jgi:MYXO-CTERM domain-containing protein
MRSFCVAPLGMFAAVAVLSTSARPARACTPPLPGLYGSRPATGSSLPANAAIHFDGYNITLDDVVVTVNGTPATLTPTESHGIGALAARVTPQPAVGATINISGTFCEPLNNCMMHALTFTALAADTATPAQPTLEVNVHDHADFSGGIGSCISDAAASWWFNLTGDTAGANDAAVIHVVEVARDASFSSVFRTVARMADNSAQVTSSMRLDSFNIGSLGVTQAFCFRAFSVDTAGQRSATTAVTCRPCHARVEAQVDAGVAFLPPDQPTWTGADVVGDGPCGTTSSSSSGGVSSSAVVVSSSMTGSSSRAGSSSTAGSSTAGSSTAGSSTAGSSTGNASSTVVGSSSSAAPDAGVKDVNVDPGAGCNCRGTETSPLMWGALVMLGWVAARKHRR